MFIPKTFCISHKTYLYRICPKLYVPYTIHIRHTLVMYIYTVIIYIIFCLYYSAHTARMEYLLICLIPPYINFIYTIFPRYALSVCIMPNIFLCYSQKKCWKTWLSTSPSTNGKSQRPQKISIPTRPPQIISTFFWKLAKTIPVALSRIGSFSQAFPIYSLLELKRVLLRFDMVSCPEIQERMYNKIKDQVGTNSLSNYADRMKLPFSEAVVMETQRYAVHEQR